ncbi:hypothetical protein [Streptomyces sp. NPDC091212]|uniref:hypothetical protein n=1 Tax=Streptomyces sp. NPDC091212 TaxID=3155191 RepID=UPI0034339934
MRAIARRPEVLVAELPGLLANAASVRAGRRDGAKLAGRGTSDDFALRPVGEHESYGYLVLDGELTPAEVGRAVMRIADCNDFEPEEEHGSCPTDPIGTFLHGCSPCPSCSPPAGSG